MLADFMDQVAAWMPPAYANLAIWGAAAVLLAVFVLLRRGLLGLRRSPVHWIVVDGSNVLHWADGTPNIATLRDVLGQLQDAGFTPKVVFDANVGYKTGSRFKGSARMADELGLPAGRVLVVDKGMPADPVILATARRHGARIVTNDRYRDWLADHPEVAEPTTFVRGRVKEGQVYLEAIE